MTSSFWNSFYINQIKIFPYFSSYFLLVPTGASSSISTTSVLHTVAESGARAAELDGGVAELAARPGQDGGREPTD
jgi:hypothetical protein